MSTFRIIDSSPFRFIWEEDPNLMQTDKNRLYEAYDYPNKYFKKSYKLVNPDDEEWYQFRTDYENVKTELFNCSGLLSTLNITSIRTEDNYTYYQVDLDASLLDGFYYIRHSLEEDADKPVAHFRSDWFNVSSNNNNTNTMLIEWYGSNPNEIPMQWSGETQQMRIRADIRTYTAGNMLATMVGSDNNIVTLTSDPINGRMLSIDNLTEYISEKMNIAVSHERFWVNGQEFKTDEPIDIGEPLGDTITYTFKVKLQEVDYLNYASDPVLTGDLPVFPDTLRTTGLTTRTTGLTDRKTNN